MRLLKSRNFLIVSISAFCCLVYTETVATPGELIAIKLNENAQEYSSNNLIIEQGKNKYMIIPVAHDQKEIIIGKYKIKVLEKDFGESRITISNLSMVDLNNEDMERAYKESQLIRAAISTYSDNKKPSLNFLQPVDGVISSRYGKKRFINDSPRSPHLALDIAAPEGTSIIAPADAKVILTGNFFYGGNYIILDHGYGMLTSYSHLSKIVVAKGDMVKQSDLIGEVGSTGRVTGPHLHWTVYLNKVRINPESLLKENYLSSLLEAI